MLKPVNDTMSSEEIFPVSTIFSDRERMSRPSSATVWCRNRTLRYLRVCIDEFHLNDDALPCFVAVDRDEDGSLLPYFGALICLGRVTDVVMLFNSRPISASSSSATTVDECSSELLCLIVLIGESLPLERFSRCGTDSWPSLVFSFTTCWWWWWSRWLESSSTRDIPRGLVCCARFFVIDTDGVTRLVAGGSTFVGVTPASIVMDKRGVSSPRMVSLRLRTPRRRERERERGRSFAHFERGRQ